MEFKQYPSYKKSGVEWLGDVPEHWGMNRLGVHFRNRKEKVSDKDFKPLSVTKHGIVPQLEHAAKSDNGDNRKLVRKGDYVINSRSDRKGSSGLADLDGSVSLINIVLTPFKTIHPKFSHYLLRSYLFQEEFYKYGHGIVADLWTTNYEDMRNIHLALPSVSEQTQISNFLEQETTRIDNLISKQEKLIELLEEQRKSIISHAVTKGLNPNAPMKDSGVEWLGEVPEHWTILKLNHTVNKIADVDHYMPETVDTGYPYLMTGDLKDRISSVDFSNCKKISELEYLHLSKKVKSKKGDLILARYATIGTVSYVDINADYIVSYSCVTIKPNHSKIIGEYLYFYIQSQAFLNFSKNYINTNTQGNLGIDSLKRVSILLPSIDEQNEIIKFIKSKNLSIDKLIGKQKSLIEKLKEYRASIISHAVTGKIDVREFGA